MTRPGPPAANHRLRFAIAALVFVSMVINYLDRQTFNALSPYIRGQYGWSYADFATLLLSFRVAYTVMQAISGCLLDRIGTRLGLALAVWFYSLVAISMATANSLAGFRTFRFLLGAGEAANWPGAIKASSEWFGARGRVLAVALFDSGTALGGAVAPLVALALYQAFDGWRPVCVLTGSLGLFWVVAWLLVCPRGRQSDRTAAETGPADAGSAGAAPAGWRQLLSTRPMWGIMLGRFLLDPYWFFVGEWFPLYLNSRGFSLEQSVLGLAAPLAASVVGNFAGGALSGYLLRRGWPVGRSRRTVLAIFGPSMLTLLGSFWTSDYATLLVLFSYGNFAYAACSTMFLSLPADVFKSGSVASASGLAGSAAGAGVLVSTWLIGRLADEYSFEPVVVAASIVPCLAAAAFVVLVRAPKRPAGGVLLRDF